MEKIEENVKTSQQRAQEKFKRVGTKLNELEQSKFNEILEREGLNQSQYIKQLIFGDKGTNDLMKKKDDLIWKQKERLGHQEKLIDEKNARIEELKNTVFDLSEQKHNLKKEIEKLENAGNPPKWWERFFRA